MLCREWENRIKGRDLYDYVFYLTRGAAINLKHLRERMTNSGHLPLGAACSLQDIKIMLSERFDSIQFAQAKQDVAPFVHDSSVLDIWSADFFKYITQDLTAV